MHMKEFSTKSTVKYFLLFPQCLLLLFLITLVPAQECWATEIPEMVTDPQFLVSAEVLKAKSKEIEASSSLDQGMKNTLLEMYRKSLGNLEKIASYEALATKFIQAIETAPADTKKIRDKLDKLEVQSKAKQNDIFDDEPPQAIEQQLLKTKSQLAEIEAKIAAFDRQLSEWNERPIKAKQRLDKIKEEEKELQAALTAPTPPDQLSQLSEAELWLRQTQLQALAVETKMLNQELVSMPVLIQLTNAQRDEALLSLERTRFLMQRLTIEVNQKRQADAARSMGQAEQAMRQMTDGAPLLQQTASTNVTLSKELQLLTAAKKHVTQEKDRLGEELKKLAATFTNAKQRSEMAGLGQAVGLLLHEQWRTLPNIELLQKKAAADDTKIAEIGLLQMQHIEARKRLDDIEAYIVELASDSPPDQISNIKPELQKLLTSQRELLDKIITENQSYLGLLAELEVLHRQLLNTVTDFDAFLAERLLWMRTLPAMQLEDFQNLRDETAAFIASSKWHETGKQQVSQLSSPPFILVYLFVVLLLWFKRTILAHLEKTVNNAANSLTYRFAMPLWAVGLTFTLALPVPLLLMTLAWQTQNLIETTDFSRAVSTSLFDLSLRFFFLRSLYFLLMPKGLAAGFFHWSEETLSLLRSEAKLLMFSFLPASFITHVIFQANYHGDGKYLLGRLFLIGTLSIICFFMYRVLHPRTGVWHRFLKENPHRILVRLYPLFFFLVMLIPLVLGGLTVAGFVVAAGVLLQCLLNSVWVVLGIVVCHQLIKRWLIQSSRRLARLKVLSLRAASATTEVAQDSELPVTEKEIRHTLEPAEDLIVLNAESRKLLDTMIFMASGICLWLVWADVLPALGIFDDFILWKYSSVIGGETTVVPVTIADAGLAIFIGAITLTVSRHFPSLLMIVLLKNLEMSPGARYTVTTLSGYIIGGTGLLIIASLLGFSWSQIQWLVAALGVGIGFGLQEIIANFISGLIILLERPIRVGDVVTIGETDGVVTRIRMRVTTIRDYDRKELLVPNKEFITGRLLNWSLSDPLLRILVPVGIAYGSDVQMAMRLMQKAAEDNELVLDDPKPRVTFDSFGDNSLLLTLHCFTDSVDQRILTKSVLHQVIDQKFREADISISFPQRDVHLDTNKPLDIRIMQEKIETQNVAPLVEQN